ncbi:hypothetical protein [Polaribacter sp. IC073]|uniref:hypothetical protein n=1 Tax=Polaribacter sp. IC073 TaxID=2508540 RepID=UPI0011BD9D2D|nr:hypothetical protein [Polaribacter sp. IC073]TXD49611.1 hypothetical protein ES045_00030 [Polaribacter sp. IC073]
MTEKKFNYSQLKYSAIIDYFLFKNFSVSQKKQYLIDNELFFTSDKNYSKRENSFYLENINSFGLTILHQKITYDIQKDIIDEYINFFDMSFNELFNGYYQGDVLSSNKIDLEKLLTKKEKIKYLKKLYKNSIKSLNNKKELDFIKISNEDEAFIKIKQFFLHQNPKDILDYLLGISFPENGTESFNYCSKLWISRKILCFCTKNIEALNILKNASKNKEEEKTKSSSGTETKDPSNYPTIFKNIKSENIFKKFLHELNAVDKNNKPVSRKFQPLCHAFYKISTDKDFKDQNVFKYNVDKNDFIKNMINIEYDLDIDRLSNGSSHEPAVQEFFEEDSNFT